MMKGLVGMKTINVKIEVPDWVDERVLEKMIRRALREVVPPSELSADEAKEIFGVIEEGMNIKAEDALKLREKEKERLKWLCSTPP